MIGKHSNKTCIQHWNTKNIWKKCRCTLQRSTKFQGQKPSLALTTTHQNNLAFRKIWLLNTWFHHHHKINQHCGFPTQSSRFHEIHLLFHVSLLELYNASTIIRQVSGPPSLIKINIEQEHEVEEILDFKLSNRQLQYLIRWKGYNISKRTLEPIKCCGEGERLSLTFSK